MDLDIFYKQKITQYYFSKITLLPVWTFRGSLGHINIANLENHSGLFLYKFLKYGGMFFFSGGSLFWVGLWIKFVVRIKILSIESLSLLLDCDWWKMRLRGTNTNIILPIIFTTIAQKRGVRMINHEVFCSYGRKNLVLSWGNCCNFLTLSDENVHKNGKLQAY